MIKNIPTLITTSKKSIGHPWFSLEFLVSHFNNRISIKRYNNLLNSNRGISWLFALLTVVAALRAIIALLPAPATPTKTIGTPEGFEQI